MRTVHLRILTVQITAFGKLLGESIRADRECAELPKDNPQSLEEARLFWSSVNLGIYRRIVAPLCQIPTLISLTLEWRSRNWRPFILVAFVLIAVADAITFAFHYPRSVILITEPLVENHGILHQTVSEWALGKWVRTGLVIGALVA